MSPASAETILVALLPVDNFCPEMVLAVTVGAMDAVKKVDTIAAGAAWVQGAGSMPGYLESASALSVPDGLPQPLEEALTNAVADHDRARVNYSGALNVLDRAFRACMTELDAVEQANVFLARTPWSGQ